MKKAFTIAEAVISAAMLGIIAVVVLPIINDFQPNKDKTAYNKALYSMQSAISNVMDDSYSIAANRLLQSGDETSSWDDSKHLQNLTGEEVCNALADNFNTVGQKNCSGSGSYEEPNFITSDGMRFWGIGSKNEFANTKDGDKQINSQVVYMDRELKKSDWKKREKDSDWNEQEAKGPGLKLIVRRDGKVYTDSSHKYENKLIEKSMSMNLKDEK